jgi:hypothetical protein
MNAYCFDSNSAHMRIRRLCTVLQHGDRRSPWSMCQRDEGGPARRSRAMDSLSQFSDAHPVRNFSSIPDSWSVRCSGLFDSPFRGDSACGPHDPRDHGEKDSDDDYARE